MSCTRLAAMNQSPPRSPLRMPNLAGFAPLVPHCAQHSAADGRWRKGDPASVRPLEYEIRDCARPEARRHKKRRRRIHGQTLNNSNEGGHVIPKSLQKSGVFPSGGHRNGTGVEVENLFCTGIVSPPRQIVRSLRNVDRIQSSSPDAVSTCSSMICFRLEGL